MLLLSGIEGPPKGAVHHNCVKVKLKKNKTKKKCVSLYFICSSVLGTWMLTSECKLSTPLITGQTLRPIL